MTAGPLACVSWKSADVGGFFHATQENAARRDKGNKVNSPIPEFRNPNSRSPKEARNPKAEASFRRSSETVLVGHLSEGGVSGFGFRA